MISEWTLPVIVMTDGVKTGTDTMVELDEELLVEPEELVVVIKGPKRIEVGTNGS